MIRTLKRLILALAITAISTAAMSTSATATTAVPAGVVLAAADTVADVQPLACGWDPDAPAGRAYYRHCTSDGSDIIIRVERHFGLSGYNLCVGPGRTPLGSLSVIKYAWYTGRLC